MFNKALLAKQMWRMIENPNHTVTKVFKAWYFKHMDIMEAPFRTNPSYIWHSLLWSRDILHKGAFWKIGDGEDINVRRDAWILDLSSGRITANTIYDNNVNVNTLILPSKRWDYDKLKDLFLLYEYEAIRRSLSGRRVVRTPGIGDSRRKVPTPLK